MQQQQQQTTPTSLYLNQFNAATKMAEEPWPEDCVLYQPYEAEQILLPENASCLAVKAYLRMCRLPFEIRASANAEFMSPGGRMTKLPFLRAGQFIVAEFEPIVTFVEHKNSNDGSNSAGNTPPIGYWLDEDEKADMRTYVSLAENIFTMAELYVCFVNERVYKEVTAPRNGCVFPWPLATLQNHSKRRAALRLLKVYQWQDMHIDDVIEKVAKCCETLTLKLEESPTTPFFYGERPCELDAIAFGHLFAILTTPLPNMALAQTVQKYGRLVEFCRHIDEQYFQQKI